MKRRILSLVLCACLLLSTVVLFASCGKKKVELEGYSLVYASDVSESTATHITTFADALSKKIDAKVSVKKVKPDADLTKEEELEILVGNTNRPESADALGKIKGHGYSITVAGSKIVIVGTTNLLTTVALDYFEDTYLSGEETISSVKIEKTVVENLEMVELTAKYAAIYSSYLDGAADLINLKIAEFKAELSNFSDVRGTAMQMLDDTQTAENEILVGIVEREECSAFISGMDANSYGVGVRNGKLLISALNDAMVEKAFALCEDILKDSVYVADEKKQILLPADLARIYTDTENKSLFTDFPRPEALELSGTIDVQDGSMAYYYTGSNINADIYASYCQTLETAGYTLFDSSSAENSIFRTYVNTEKNATLYVAYNAFKHATAQEVTYYEPCIRIVSALLSNVNLLDDDIKTQNLGYTKLQNSSITSLKLDNEYQESSRNIYGNSYIVTLEDGSFIVYDGGQSYVRNKERLYNALCDLYKRGNHETDEPTTTDPIRIAAWIVSHGHGDHYLNMQEFINFYCFNYNKYCVTIDRLIANFISDEEAYNSGNPSDALRNGYAELSTKISDAPGKEGGFEYIKVHTGQKFYLANAEFEVIYTHEDQYPRRIHTYNNSSTVFRMILNHTNGNGQISADSTTTMLWLGDAQDDASKWMRATYGEYLDSDMVQVAHHNYDGCEWKLYQLVSPELVWWPVNRLRYNGANGNTCHDASAKAGTTKHVNYSISYRLDSVKYIILADDFNYTVTITANGPDYNLAAQSSTGIFSAGETAAVTPAVNVSSNVATSLLKK